MTQFLSCVKSVLAIFAVGAATLSAGAETYDFGVMEPDVEYSFPSFSEVKGEYTPTVTGSVKIMYSNNPLSLYTSPSHSEESLVAGSHSYVTGGQIMTYDKLEAGTKYYVYDKFTMGEGTLVIHEGSMELSVVSVSPNLEEGEQFSVSSNYTIDVEFNYPVTVTKALLLAGDGRKTISATAGGSSVTCSVADAVMDFYRNGVIRGGDVMTLRLLGVADAADPENEYNGNGKLEINFVMADKPGELVETVNADCNNLNNPFLSYYRTGDETGKVTFIFDRELGADAAPYAKITYGDPDNMDLGVYSESVPGVCEGDSVTFDFCGKLRRPIDMIPGSTPDTQPDYLHILFADIYTADGQRVYTGRLANPSGYSLSFKMNLVQYTVASDFTPSRGSSLAPGMEMEIWVMNGAYIDCSGISFSYLSQGEEKTTVVPLSEVTAAPDPVAEEDMIFTLNVPELPVDEGSDVTVSLADAECADGLDHTKDFSAVFSYGKSGVEGVIAGGDSETVSVYNVAGVCVMENVSREALKSLPQGLYIVGGRKLIVR